MKILIVDDELNNRFLLQKILAPYGICDLVVNGQEAMEAFDLAHAEQKPYDLICMDIMMPEMDGHQAVQEMRKKEMELGILPKHEAKVLMVTATSSTHTIINTFYKDGCTDYLVKPVTKEIVEKKLVELGFISPPRQ